MIEMFVTNWLANNPQGLWIVDKFSVDKSLAKSLSPWSVENIQISTKGLLTKSYCGSKRKCTFPHKFSLLLLLLQISIYLYIFLYINKKGF